MSPSTGELLLKAIRSLPDDEQEQLLSHLLDRVAAGPGPVGPAPVRPAPAGPALADVLRRVPAELALSGRAPVLQPLGHLPPVSEDPGLKVLPVRLPAGDYERLRDWSKQHDFSMAVIVRTLVERFLNAQAAAG